jgi:hypothetical protein
VLLCAPSLELREAPLYTRAFPDPVIARCQVELDLGVYCLAKIAHVRAPLNVLDKLLCAEGDEYTDDDDSHFPSERAPAV